MSEHTPQNPPPTGPYPPTEPPNPYGPGQPPGYPPPTQPPAGPYATPPSPPPYSPGQPPGQPPPGQPPTGQYPPTPPAPPYPPGQPPGQPPPGQPPTGQYPPTPPAPYPGQPEPPPTGQYPPTPTPPYAPGQPPPGPYGEPGPGYPPPTPAPCPDPCDEGRPYGPPQLRPECCPDDRKCCGDQQPTPRAWDETDDPCLRAASGACGVPWAKVSCKCESSDPACCEEWDCGSPEGMCVPCKPCEGLLPEGETPETSGCEDPTPTGCSSDALQLQLEANKKCISARQTEKAQIEADIKARLERDKDLAALISNFDGIVEKYKTERYKLSCREDCLKGFHRDVAESLKTKFAGDCLKAMETAINAELCAIEKAKCCQKNLEGKLGRETRLIRQQLEAEKAWKSAEEAFAQVKDLPKWMGDRFTDLEKLKDQIAQALNDKDPLKHRYAFYLFYWKFVPGLCRRFKVAICCTGDEATARGAAHQVHIGCTPGDWHPSKVSPEALTRLICCAWDHVRHQKEEFQTATAAVDAAKQHLDFIKKRVEDDAKTLEDRIRRRIEQVVCAPAASSR